MSLFTPEHLEKAQEAGLGRTYRSNWCAPVGKALFHNPKFMEEVGPYLIVYQTLWANIIGSGWKDSEGAPLKKDYHDKGKLVCSLPQNVLANKLFIGKGKINTAIKRLIQAGVIEIVGKVKIGRNWQHVYELGSWHDKLVGEKIRRHEYYKLDKYYEYEKD